MRLQRPGALVSRLLFGCVLANIALYASRCVDHGSVMNPMFIVVAGMVTLSFASTGAAQEAPSACFPGAYYRKVVSTADLWTGIEAVVTLPRFSPDFERTNPKTGRPLDNASLYLGGRAGGQEIDAGVSWEVIREANGAPSKSRKAFRPFWRNDKWHTGPADPRFYYFPGDTLRMSCTATSEPGKLRLEIALLSRAGEHEITSSTLPRDPLSTLSEVFEASSFGPATPRQFKRVNAIDQSGNEGKPVQPTAARAEGAAWHEVWLLRGSQRQALDPGLFTSMTCPAPEHFVLGFPVPQRQEGAETVSICGGTTSAATAQR